MGGQFNFVSYACSWVHFLLLFARAVSNGRMQPTVCCVDPLHLHKNCMRYKILVERFLLSGPDHEHDIQFDSRV